MACKKPENLRKMVTENRSFSPPLISKDKGNVSEMDILHNRIDQQVELISVLKQRLDEVTKRWERSEAEQEQQELERSKVQQSHNKLADKHANLELRWRQLTDNHTEMILLKDDYKEKCRVMKERLKKLESGESAAVATEQRKCATLHGRIEEMRTEIKDRSGRENDLLAKIKQLEARIKHLEDREKSLVEELNTDRGRHMSSISQFEIKLSDNFSVIKDKDNRNESLTQEINDLTQQIINRGKIVQDKENQFKRLETDKIKVDEKNKELSKELNALKESINANKIVRDLRETLSDEKDRYRKLEIEVLYFKEAAKAQLQKEKNMNEELRHVSLQSR